MEVLSNSILLVNRLSLDQRLSDHKTLRGYQWETDTKRFLSSHSHVRDATWELVDLGFLLQHKHQITLLLGELQC